MLLSAAQACEHLPAALLGCNLAQCLCDAGLTQQSATQQTLGAGWLHRACALVNNDP